MEFPVGTGIYRVVPLVSVTTRRVPCRYRDIPGVIVLVLTTN